MVQEKVGIVTVTYGNRTVYIKKTLNKLFKLNNVSKIVVVANGVSEDCKIALEELRSKNQDKLIIHDLGYNSGSAKGFKEGLLRVLKEQVNYIWLLDDDNVPREDALNQLFETWKRLNITNKDVFSLLSYRPDRVVYKNAIQKHDPYLMLGCINSFLGFHLFDKLKNILKKDANFDNQINNGKVAVAPYGGMFFSKALINSIGLPDERFFLYADDHEFSYRITKKQGEIILVLNSVVDDIETSFHLKKERRIFNTRFFGTDSKNAIYYSVRNNIYFEKNFITNKVLYTFNKVFYIFLLFLLFLINYKHFWKFSIMIKAIKDSNKFIKND